jgi:hypothetical protein
MHLASQKIIVIWRLAQSFRPRLFNINVMLMMPDDVTLGREFDQINLIQSFLEFKACIPTLYPRSNRRIMIEAVEEPLSSPENAEYALGHGETISAALPSTRAFD